MGKKVFAVLVLMLFVAGSVAFAGGSCNTCGQPSPCNTCGTPKSCGTPACEQLVKNYKRDVLGNRVPVFTEDNGTWHNDAAGTHSYVITGTEPGANS